MYSNYIVMKPTILLVINIENVNTKEFLSNDYALSSLICAFNQKSINILINYDPQLKSRNPITIVKPIALKNIIYVSIFIFPSSLSS
jgi:hypothetical protein